MLLPMCIMYCNLKRVTKKLVIYINNITSDFKLVFQTLLGLPESARSSPNNVSFSCAHVPDVASRSLNYGPASQFLPH